MEKDIEEILKFELDKNGFPKLTEKNVKLIDFIIKNDSNYRSDNDKENRLSTIILVKQYQKEPSKENLRKVIKAIDKQNSTHLSVTGQEKGSNQGIELTTKYIFYKIGINELNKQIKHEQNSLVDDIAKNSIPNRYVISFASKFCTYMSRYMFNKEDKFSIYDGVMSSILPYYYYQYVNEKEKIVITKEVMKKRGYKWYSDIICKIIKEAEEKENYKISRKDFDHLLWYYYKGDKDKKDNNGNINYKSRITRALEHIK